MKYDAYCVVLRKRTHILEISRKFRMYYIFVLQGDQKVPVHLNCENKNLNDS